MARAAQSDGCGDDRVHRQVPEPGSGKGVAEKGRGVAGAGEVSEIGRGGGEKGVSTGARKMQITLALLALIHRDGCVVISERLWVGSSGVGWLRVGGFCWSTQLFHRLGYGRALAGGVDRVVRVSLRARGRCRRDASRCAARASCAVGAA